jgi:hypothetical protein
MGRVFDTTIYSVFSLIPSGINSEVLMDKCGIDAVPSAMLGRKAPVLAKEFK